MYSKQESARLRREFWTAFGQYMLPVLSADGEKVSWLNYKTGERHLAFRLEADNKKASIAIELSHSDAGIRQLYFEQFLQLRTLFEAAAGKGWTWQAAATDAGGRPVSRIYREQHPVSIFKKEDWPALISFFKQHLLALDAFWSEARYSFEALR